jgi:hypothetical protein
MKKSKTNIALTIAIAIATTTFQGSGIVIHVTATVTNVKKNKVIAIPQRNLADEIWCPLIIVYSNFFS